MSLILFDSREFTPCGISVYTVSCINAVKCMDGGGGGGGGEITRSVTFVRRINVGVSTNKKKGQSANFRKMIHITARRYDVSSAFFCFECFIRVTCSKCMYCTAFPIVYERIS